MANEYVHIFSCSNTLADRAGRTPQANGVEPQATRLRSATLLMDRAESSLHGMLINQQASVAGEGMDGKEKCTQAVRTKIQRCTAWGD